MTLVIRKKKNVLAGPNSEAPRVNRVSVASVRVARCQAFSFVCFSSSKGKQKGMSAKAVSRTWSLFRLYTHSSTGSTCGYFYIVAADCHKVVFSLT